VSAIRERVLRALALNREPGFHFAGNFAGISFDRTEPSDSHVSLATGAHLEDHDGQVNIGALGMLADMALAASIRGGLDPSTRIATVSMTLQLTGTRAIGPLHAASRFEGFFGGGHSRQGLSRVVVEGAAGPVCHGHGAFMALEPPPGFTHFPLPRGERAAAALGEKDLTREERVLLRHAEETLAGGDADFLRRFWGYAGAHRTKEGAACVMKNGAHVANRVHHVQGGLLLGLAVSTAAAALPPKWATTGVTACFVSPGIGRVLRARSRVVHHGLMTAVVRTEVTGPNRRRVLEALSTHARVSS
jgi:acyl-coenzyme A thioesterase PaaI-like protein